MSIFWLLHLKKSKLPTWYLVTDSWLNFSELSLREGELWVRKRILDVFPLCLTQAYDPGFLQERKKSTDGNNSFSRPVGDKMFLKEHFHFWISLLKFSAFPWYLWSGRNGDPWTKDSERTNSIWMIITLLKTPFSGPILCPSLEV